MNNLFTFQPQLPGYEHAGPEPCLRQLVWNYYADHFSPTESHQFTEQYFEQLEEQFNASNCT